MQILPNSDHRDPLDERLKSLDSQLREHDVSQKEGERKSNSNHFANAMRLSTEFVAAILVGLGIGWAIDWFLGTAPWATIIFLPLGFAAGVKNVLRSAAEQADADSQDEEK